jgi:hypothetical protein
MTCTMTITDSSRICTAVVSYCQTAPLTAVSFGSVDPYARDVPPDFGLYLDKRWRPPWPHGHLDWPDFGIPDDPVLVVEPLGSLLDRARAGQRVEIGCYGGHGRTGTALACLAILCGQAPGTAASWVRDGVLRTCGRDSRARSLRPQLHQLTPGQSGKGIRALRRSPWCPTTPAYEVPIKSQKFPATSRNTATLPYGSVRGAVTNSTPTDVIWR